MVYSATQGQPQTFSVLPSICPLCPSQWVDLLPSWSPDACSSSKHYVQKKHSGNIPVLYLSLVSEYTLYKNFPADFPIVIGQNPIACLCLSASLRRESKTTTLLWTNKINHIGLRLPWQTQPFRMK